MWTGRKQTTDVTKQWPNNVPLNYAYPQYGYVAQPSHYSLYTIPYAYSLVPYKGSGFISTPINMYYQTVEQPINFPSIANRHDQEYDPRSINRSSCQHSQRDRISYETYYCPRHRPYRHSLRDDEKSRHDHLPAIHKHSSISTQLISPNDNEHQQFIVHDLTEHT